MSFDMHHTDHEEALTTAVFEKVVGDDLVSLNAAERAEYYQAVCRSVGLNPLTKPLEFLHLNGRLRLYALRDATDQLRRLHGISITIVNRQRELDIYVVTARATDPNGRTDESTGAVAIGVLKGEPLANALMKAETKAKRRSTLSICGLGWLDETEIETIPGARVMPEPALDTPALGVTTALDPPAAEAHPTTEQISALIELARACDADLVGFGPEMRRIMDLSADTKVTRKFLRDSMTMAHFGVAWAHYNQTLRNQVEADSEVDVPDHGTPASPPTPQNAQEGIQPPQGSTIADDPLPLHSDEGELDEEDDPIEMASLIQMATLRQMISQLPPGEVRERLQHRLEAAPQGLTRDEAEAALTEVRAAQSYRKS
jgi:hypothetical protein